MSRRKNRELRRRQRQRRIDAKMRKFHKHRKLKPQKPREIISYSPPAPEEVPHKGIVNSPLILSVLLSVKDCVRFFSNIRGQANAVKNEIKKRVTLNIADIQEIDLPTIMVLSALGRELSGKGINLAGNFPQKKECREFFVKTGFLNDKVDASGMRFNKSEKTEYFNLNKGQGKLRATDTIQICRIVRHACDHLKREDFYDDVVSMIKEIAGNSIEWSHSYREQWTLGVMFNDDYVTFSILDLGRGILETIVRKFKIKNLFQNDIAFLSDVFDKQYSSSSLEENRYKGLPSIKKAHMDGKVQNLCVMTNNVLMRFDSPQGSEQFSMSRKAFNGTLYYWKINKLQ